MSEYTVENYTDFLLNSPIYVKKTFSNTKMLGHLHVPRIKYFCSTCQDSSFFSNDFDPEKTLKGPPPPVSPVSLNGFKTTAAYRSDGVMKLNLIFTCIVCKISFKEYCVMAEFKGQDIVFEKYGERPRKPLDTDKELNKFFKNDKEYYDKAIVCMSHGYGIAAYTYLRRIIEHNIISLIDMISEYSTEDELSPDIKNALVELKNGDPMSKKIKIANSALPKYLMPNGINPLGTIYKLLSEGVHALSDEECLEKAEDLTGCLKYLISQISTNKKNREDFIKTISKLR